MSNAIDAKRNGIQILAPAMIIAAVVLGCTENSGQESKSSKVPPQAAHDDQPGGRETAKEAPDVSTDDLVREARGLAQEQKWQLAVEAFAAAHDRAPNDPAIAADLGWAAFQAGDYERARRSTEKVLTLNAEPKLQGAAHYNLGRIAEARGDTSRARNEYKKSLAVRPGNGTVEERLAALSEEGGEAGDPCRNGRAVRIRFPGPKKVVRYGVKNGREWKHELSIKWKQDLDGDGRAEIATSWLSAGGSKGDFPHAVFSQCDAGYVVVFPNPEYGEDHYVYDLQVAQGSTSGWRDLVEIRPVGSQGRVKQVTWRFQNGSYVKDEDSERFVR